jgi:predicted HAD superfamily Cof-like phosphohydrolase
MNKHIEQIKEFHSVYKLPMRNKPAIIPEKEFTLRHRLLIEEVRELQDAWEENDIVEVTDAIVDCIYILLGTAVTFGIADKLKECFDEVHRSNMSKLDENGNPLYREDGKVIKSKLFSPPDIKSIIDAA